MSLVYGSVCSGIEAASVAWEPLGWRCAFVSEIEKFPSRVLAARYGCNLPGEPFPANGIPNHGDFTKIPASAGPIDLLVGGTPCQSFSVAGKRLGLDDPRGNLALEYLALARRLGARWFVWENVPGVLSSRSDDGSSDFATFLSLAVECGYGVAWRVLDAQHVRTPGFPRAVPQRRRRVFVVGHLGDWRRAAAVLLDPEGMRGDPPPRREAGQGTAVDVAPSLVSSGRGVERTGETRGQDPSVAVISERPVAGTVPSKWAKGAGGPAGDEVQNLVAHALRGEGFDASEDGTGRGTPLVPVCEPLAFSAKDYGADAVEGVSPTLRSGGHDGSHANGGVMPAIAFDLRGREGGAMPEGPHDTANIRAASGGSSRSYVAIAIQERAVSANVEAGPQGKGFQADLAYTLEARNKVQSVAVPWAVRRLTPVECERLQGFPDGWTDIGDGKGGPTPDGPRYKALGNSMAINVMELIGRRIDLFERLVAEGRIPAAAMERHDGEEPSAAPAPRPPQREAREVRE